MRRGIVARVLCGFLASVGWTCGAAAQTLPPCDSLNLPRPIYGAGSNGITAIFGRIGSQLAALPEPVTLLYSDPSQCTGIGGFLAGQVRGAFWYWTAAGEQRVCSAPAEGRPVDFAHASSRITDCVPGPLPADASEFLAPVQSLSIVTGTNSRETAISAEALYFVYGFGAAGEAAPWTNDAHIIRRQPTSAMTRLLGEAIGVDAASLKGNLTYDDPIASILEFSAVQTDTAIAYVSGSLADRARHSVKTLAYQAKEQTCGYWPDSTPVASDKANIRSGQYGLWVPGHFYARRAEASDAPAHEGVARLLRWFDGTEAPPPGVDVIGSIIDAGDVPLCAMRAMRQTISGAISSWAPPVPCTHSFEKRATGTTSGVSCSDDAKCDQKAEGSRCRFGFCELY